MGFWDWVAGVGEKTDRQIEQHCAQPDGKRDRLIEEVMADRLVAEFPAWAGRAGVYDGSAGVTPAQAWNQWTHYAEQQAPAYHAYYAAFTVDQLEQQRDAFREVIHEQGRAVLWEVPHHQGKSFDQVAHEAAGRHHQHEQAQTHEQGRGMER